MALFRIYRMKEGARQQFRWAPHALGASLVKPKDYEAAGEVAAGSPYEAWAKLRGTAEALAVGDLVVTEAGEVCICKYVGFEEARWAVPEAAQTTAGEPAPVEC